MKERVQKLMAQADLGSRRACEEIIREGRVRVNGKVIQLGAKADPEADIIEVDGEKLAFSSAGKIYIAFNKPVNVLSTSEEHHRDDRKTVRELVPVEGHLFTVGRLDADSDGLIVLTNDGDLAQRLTHPRYGHTKTYKVIVHGLPSPETLARWESGVYLEEGKTAPCSVQVVKGDRHLSTLRVIMREGKKRQIRRVASLLGHPVKKLTRTHVGRLGLGSLRPGEWMQLTRKDVELMLKPAEELEIARRSRPLVVAKSQTGRKPAPKHTQQKQHSRGRPRR